MSFTFYYTIDSDSVREYMPADVPWMLPASSWARKRLRSPCLPEHVREVACDSGGFVATFQHGDYQYTPAQYVTWLRGIRPEPRWAATMDFCCEDEITSGTPGVVRERQQRTTDMAYRFWTEYRRVPWCWVPTIQGWTVSDYRRHARELRPLIDEMADYYGPGSEWRVGIGTLCRRADVRMIDAVVRAVAREIPGLPLHLWGVKLAILQSSIALPAEVVSVDSAAWNGLYGRGLAVYRESGLTQRAYTLGVALPAYRAKVTQALRQPKQLLLLG